MIRVLRLRKVSRQIARLHLRNELLVRTVAAEFLIGVVRSRKREAEAVNEVLSDVLQQRSVQQ